MRQTLFDIKGVANENHHGGREAPQSQPVDPSGRGLRQMKHNRGFVRFLTAGNVKVKSELMMLAISQNIQKVISKRNAGKLETHILHPAAYLKF